jgi:hypothetical protein
VAARSSLDTLLDFEKGLKDVPSPKLPGLEPKYAPMLQACTRVPNERASLWAATVAGSIAVVHLEASANGAGVMVATAEVNLDKSVHHGSVTQMCEAFVTVANSSVLLSGDSDGSIGVRRRLCLACRCVCFLGPPKYDDDLKFWSMLSYDEQTSDVTLLIGILDDPKLQVQACGAPYQPTLRHAPACSFRQCSRLQQG